MKFKFKNCRKINIIFLLRLAILFTTVIPAPAQTNFDALNKPPSAISNSSTQTFSIQTNASFFLEINVEEIRAACIDARRSICGKILKVLPDGLVVESGYTNLFREPLTRDWLAPGTVSATRATNLVEGNEPDSICVGLVFLTNLPKARGPKPKLYDYVLIEGYPSGQYAYVSVGNVHRTVRKFSASLEAAIKWKITQ